MKIDNPNALNTVFFFVSPSNENLIDSYLQNFEPGKIFFFALEK